ncbi:hypothetical protein Aperf_G00000123521 [Anoplocephala perfoliata]
MPQIPASKGGMRQPSSAFHCPSNSVGSACLADFLRLDISSANKRLLRFEICPYAHPNSSTSETIYPSKSRVAEGEEKYYGLSTAAPNSPIIVLGPVYNFTSIDFEINLQLGGPIPHLGGANETAMYHHGWVKGLLFEYILLHCPQLPDELEGGGQVRYALHTHNDATGATVAVAEAACPPNTFFFPTSKETDIEAFNITAPENFLDDLDSLQNQLILTCNHHSRIWTPVLPKGGCMTRDQIREALRELINSKLVRKLAPEANTTNTGDEKSTDNFTLIASAVEPRISAAVLKGGNESGLQENAKLSRGSSAVVGAIFGFLLCLLLLVIIIFVFRHRLSRLVRSKLVTSNTLPKRFPGSGMFMNTLSGSLTFSRQRKNPYFSPSHHPTALMTQSAVFIPSQHISPQQPQSWFNNSSKPASNAVSLGSLHSPKPQHLPPLPPVPIPPTDLEMALSDRPPSSVHTQNSTSLSTKRQTMLSADTITTSLSAGGQPSPGAAMGYRGASTDGLGDAFVESPDDNQVFSATLPWKSKPQRGVTGGLKRLSTFFRSAISSSSASFHHSNQNGGSHPGPQTGSTVPTPGSFTRRQQFAGGGWPSGSFVSGSSATSGANSLGLLSSGQSGSSFVSEATLQPMSPLSSSGQISNERKAQVCLVDPALCRLNHQHHRAEQQTPISADIGGTILRRGTREDTPLPPLPPQYPHHSNSNSSGPSNKQNHPGLTTNMSVRDITGKTGTLNMDTYLEPIEGTDMLNRLSTNAVAEDVSVTEIISGGTLSEDSDTGQQVSWPSLAPDGTNTGAHAVEATDSTAASAPRNGNTLASGSGIGDTVDGTAPIATSDPTTSLENASFEEDSSSAADYFTYDQNHRSHGRKHDKVIRRPRLSPPHSPRNRPLSDAMLSNHYYDKSELLKPDMIGGLRGAPEVLFDPRFHDPTSRPTSLGVYSNDEEADEDEDSSLYEAVDRRSRRVAQVGGALPPAPHPPVASSPSQQMQDSLEMFSSPHRNGGLPSPSRYRRHRGSSKTAATTNASTSTLIGDPATSSSTSSNDPPNYANL